MPITDRQQAALDAYPLATNYEGRARIMSERTGQPVNARNYQELLKRARQALAREEEEANRGLSPSSVDYLAKFGHTDLKGFHSAWLKTTNEETGEGLSMYIQGSKPGERTWDDIKNDVIDAILELTPPEPLPSIDHADDKLLNNLIATDEHLSLRTWFSSSGVDSGLEKAVKIHKKAYSSLISRMPAAAVGLFTDLGDAAEQNDHRRVTPRSGHVLDLDAGYSDTFKAALDLKVFCIRQMLERCEKVVVRLLPGNHDPSMQAAMSWALWAWYRNERRVEVVVPDIAEDAWFFYLWGVTLLAYNHGDGVKPGNMKGYLVDRVPELWGQSKIRRIRHGHLHNASAQSDGNCVIEGCNSLVPLNAWAFQRFTGEQSIFAETYHADAGLWDRYYYVHLEDKA